MPGFHLTLVLLPILAVACASPLLVPHPRHPKFNARLPFTKIRPQSQNSVWKISIGTATGPVVCRLCIGPMTAKLLT
jgi:hypothetical protein